MLLRENREGILEGVASSLNGWMVGERKGLLLSLSQSSAPYGGGRRRPLSLLRAFPHPPSVGPYKLTVQSQEKKGPLCPFPPPPPLAIAMPFSPHLSRSEERSLQTRGIFWEVAKKGVLWRVCPIPTGHQRPTKE